MDALDLTIARQVYRSTKVAGRLGQGDTDEGLAFTGHLYGNYVEIFTSLLEKTKKNRGFKGHQRQILSLDVDKITVLALNSAISAISHTNGSLVNTLRVIGNSAYMECYGYSFGQYNYLEANRFELLAKAKNSSLKQRRAAVRAYARKLTDFAYPAWSDRDKISCGRFILEGLLSGNAFCLDSEGKLSLTEEALNNLDQVNASIIMRSLLGVPITGDLPDWHKSTLIIDNLPYSLIRSYQKPVKAHVDRAVRNGSMSSVLTALNHIQSTQWRINRPILDLVKFCFDNHVKISGLPSKADIEIPVKPLAFEDMSSNQRTAWKRKAAQVQTANRGLLAERIILSRDLSMADYLIDKPFKIPHNLDYRGRVYGIPHFNFQRQDHIRAMFMFNEGQLLNTDGLYWLKVHIANTGDFNKISKQPFDERVWWTDDNLEKLVATAAEPIDDLWWTQADKPFMFVAACMALRDALEGREVHVPISFDGSCSGLQHLAAQSRCETTGALVNLVNYKQPSDIYQTVAERVKSKVTADLDSSKILEFRTGKEPLPNREREVIRTVNISDLAKMCLDYGITRSLVKRNTMTFSYSSRRAGMQKQILEDTMRPLQLLVLSGELEKHPFGDDGGYAAARYLSGVTYSSIVETVERPAQVMRYLQNISRVMAHEAMPTFWTTPLGLPVMLRCPKTDSKCIDIFLHDKGVKIRIQPRSNLEIGGISKQHSIQAVAPSFVHSYDACHLMMVVLASMSKIKSIALVHDSFGCLPNDSRYFREIIKQTFVNLYTTTDVLEQIKQENLAHLVTVGYKLPEIPKRGSLSIEEINYAEYAFA